MLVLFDFTLASLPEGKPGTFLFLGSMLWLRPSIIMAFIFGADEATLLDFCRNFYHISKNTYMEN